MRRAVFVVLLVGVEMSTKFLWGNLGEDCLVDLGLEDRIILKWMFIK
jgi:hypothetical protein